MKLNDRQTRAKGIVSRKLFLPLLTGCLLVLLSSSESFAPTKLSEKELSDIDSQAIFEITHYTGTSPGGAQIPFGTSHPYQTGSTDVIRIRLGTQMEMSAYIRSFKLGYYDGGWDQDVTNYFWGNRTTSGPVLTAPLRWADLFIDFGFNALADNATKTLNYIELGTTSALGNVTGTLNQVNALQLAGTGTNSGVMLRGTAGGARVIGFTGGAMSFVFASSYRYVSRTAGAYGYVSGIFVKLPDYHTENNLERP